MANIKHEIIEKIFKSVNYEDGVSSQDPDHGYIEKKINRLPENRLTDFYEFLREGREYRNEKSGAILLHKVALAVSDFMEILKGELWKEHDLENKVYLLSEKIHGIMNYSANFTAQEWEARVNHLDLTKTKFTNVETQEKELLSEDELRIINEYGLDDLIKKMGDLGTIEFRQILEKSFKNIYSERFLMSGEESDVKKLSSNGGNPVAKKVKLLSNVKKM